MQNSLVFLLSFVLLCATAKTSSYSSLCDSVFCRIIDDSNKEISDLRASVDDGVCIPQFGVTADQICNSALERFSDAAPLPDDVDQKESEAIYDKKIDDLERLLDAPLHVIYLKQLALIREKSLKTFKTAVGATEGTEFDAMMQADEFYRKEAEESTRQNPEWSYAKECHNLKTALLEIANKSKKIADVKLQASKQNSQAMQYLQMQQQQLQAIQQQVQGQSSPWNIGAAYRVPDSNINLSGTYQQGKANLQVSCVPDESVPLLGPNGFTHGVTPGNIGVSFNINI
jgi:hypothetical protein